jgi:hypothetical protein
MDVAVAAAFSRDLWDPVAATAALVQGDVLGAIASDDNDDVRSISRDAWVTIMSTAKLVSSTCEAHSFPILSNCYHYSDLIHRALLLEYSQSCALIAVEVSDPPSREGTQFRLALGFGMDALLGFAESELIVELPHCTALLLRRRCRLLDPDEDSSKDGDDGDDDFRISLLDCKALVREAVLRSVEQSALALYSNKSSAASSTCDSLEHYIPAAYLRIICRCCSEHPSANAPAVLILGTGAGILPLVLSEVYRKRGQKKGALVCVDLSPGAIQIAHEWFGLGAVDGVQLMCADAVEFVRHSVEHIGGPGDRKTYFPLIVVDLFSRGSWPAHAVAQSFIEGVDR